MAAKGYEIYRQDGENFRSLRVDRQDDCLRISGLDMGKSVEEAFGKSDYEFWVDVPLNAMTDLAIALIRHHYSGRAGAVSEIRKVCEEFGVENTFQTW